MSECTVTYTIQTIFGILTFIPFAVLGFGGLYYIKKLANAEIKKLATPQSKETGK